jgi:hypothetical protein
VADRFAGHADIRTTEAYFVRKEEDAELAARRIQIRLTGRKGGEPGARGRGESRFDMMELG